MEDDSTTASASASGILGCLGLLAEEAASLGLHQTCSAIIEALAVASRECGAVSPACSSDTVRISRPSRVH